MSSTTVYSLLLILLTFTANSVERIENFDIDRKRVNKIYIAFAKACVIRFPDTVEEIRVGIPQLYTAETSKTYAREITLNLSQESKNPSNLIVRTTNEDIYVFDLVPSKHNHQDVVYVDDSFYKAKKKIKNIKKTKLFTRIKPKHLFKSKLEKVVNL